MALFRFVCVPLERVPFDDKRRALAMWQEARRDRPLPTWGRDLAFTDFPSADIPRMVLVEPTADPTATLVRFAGTSARDAVGEDLTGRRLRDLADGDFVADIAAQYAEVVAAAEPRFFVTRLRPYRIGELFEGMLRLPFGADHAHVDTIVSLAFAEKDGFAVRRMWEEAGASPPRFATG